METIENGKAALISGIEKDGRAEAENIIAEAEKLAQEQKTNIEQQVKSIIEEAEKKFAEQAEAIKRKKLAGVEIKVKRRVMQIHDTILKDIMNKVKNELHALINKPEYKEILQNWIIEAAIGLGASSADVNTTPEELQYINRKFLTEAENRIKSIVGITIKLEISKNSPLNKQGVLLTAADGRTAFNNQLPTRIFRKQREIRKYIYDNLFTEDRD